MKKHQLEKKTVKVKLFYSNCFLSATTFPSVQREININFGAILGLTRRLFWVTRFIFIAPTFYPLLSKSETY